MLTLQSLLAHSRKSKLSQKEAHWSQRWPVNGPWIFPKLSPGCGYRKARCLIYSSDSSVPSLAALLTGLGWLPLLSSNVANRCQKISTFPWNLLLAYILDFICFTFGVLCLKNDSQMVGLVFSASPADPFFTLPHSVQYLRRLNQLSYTNSWIQPMVDTSKRSEGYRLLLDYLPCKFHPCQFSIGDCTPLSSALSI